MVMAKRKIISLIRIILSAVIVVLCVSSCKQCKDDSLYFVDSSQPVPPAKRSLIIVTHGWIEKGDQWPKEMAMAIRGRVDSNQWLCGYFDWSKGANKVNPTDAAQYARDTAAVVLAEEILKLGADFKHIHLIGHSGGCWAISEAAKILARQTSADLHLTFFDAYVPLSWKQSELGNIETREGAGLWIEHYYTRDYTLKWTEVDLSFAHNIDVTNIDQRLKDHNFPWRWYHATITGKYPKDTFSHNDKVIFTADGIEYGFARSREASGDNNWRKSMELPIGNKAVEFGL